MSSHRRALAAMASLVVLLPTSAVADEVTPLACGAEVQQDLTLSSDMGCAGTIAVRVTEQGVRLDLGGHRIEGSIIIEALDVTITNGTVVGDGTGNQAGGRIQGMGFTNVRVDRVRAERLVISSFPGPIVTGSVIVDSAIPSFSGVVVADSHLVNTPIDIAFRGSLTLRGSTIDGGDVSARGGVIRAEVTDNVVRRASVLVGSVGPVTIERNRVSDGTIGIGGSQHLTDASIIGNTVTGSASHGISVGGTRSSVITGNQVLNNAGHGIVFGASGPSASYVLSNNRAMANGGLGIAAQGQVTDGGSNVAAGNADRRQCLGVVCRGPAARP